MRLLLVGSPSLARPRARPPALARPPLPARPPVHACLPQAMVHWSPLALPPVRKRTIWWCPLEYAACMGVRPSGSVRSTREVISSTRNLTTCEVVR